MTPKAIEQASPDVREVIDRKLRAALDAAVEQHMPVMVVQTAYLSDVADHMLRLQAELAEAREVPGRIVDWLIGSEAMGMGRSEIIDAIEARDWSKP